MGFDTVNLIKDGIMYQAFLGFHIGHDRLQVNFFQYVWVKTGFQGACCGEDADAL